MFLLLFSMFVGALMLVCGLVIRFRHKYEACIQEQVILDYWDHNVYDQEIGFDVCPMDEEDILIIHGCPGQDKLYLSSEKIQIAPRELISRFLDKGILSGRPVKIVCCYPGHKKAGQVRGTKFSFVGKHRTPTQPIETYMKSGQVLLTLIG